MTIDGKPLILCYNVLCPVWEEMMPVPLPRIPTVDEEPLEKLREHRRANPRPLSPCVDQTHTEIAGYYRAVEIGGVVVIRHTQGHTLRYDIGIVEGRDERCGIVYVQGRH
ncbi:hypothetical protein G6K88_34650 [Agrobacterium rhizogenes]|uniref:hypothetical protein n=1 Tax=Rhizobium rhizogenes TaxID=359 RepID=UPI0015725FA0|nr:hypothetical protein [Rhizobium rhizogenes]NTH68534.1 hypothetical protein [Rhizobium rhizogenes]NTI07150.1 hypothetical protein [Rhizobium rhizogenes]NTI13964.1 hypothetical protein [Rhizobium rhizogenes]